MLPKKYSPFILFFCCSHNFDSGYDGLPAPPPPPPPYHDSRNFTLSPEPTDCDSADLASELSVPSAGEGSYHSSGPRHTSMPILEVITIQRWKKGFHDSIWLSVLRFSKGKMHFFPKVLKKWSSCQKSGYHFFFGGGVRAKCKINDNYQIG